MSAEWNNLSLGELFKVKHGFAFKGEYFVDEPTDSLLVTPGNFAIGGGFQNPKPKYYSGPIPEEYVLEPGKIVVTMTDLSKQSDTLGLPAVIPDDGLTWLHNQRVGLLEFKENFKTHPRFVSYLLRDHTYRSWIIGSATGTTVKHTSPNRIESFECLVPSYDEQTAIAHILGTLDDKIELNRQMNETLEAMAQGLFKSWFVDFDPVIDNTLAAGNEIPEPLLKRAAARQALGDQRKPLPADIQSLFPNCFVFTDEMGWIPEGWCVVKLPSVVEKYIDNRGKTPPLEPVGIPLLEVKHLSETTIFPNLNVEKRVSRETYESWFRAYLEANDIVISTVGTIGRICLVPEEDEVAIAQNLLGLRFDKEKTDQIFMYYQMKNKRFVDAVDARLVTTVQASIKRKDLDTIDILSMPIEIQNAFCNFVLPTIARQSDRQNRILSNLRDILLPKLLSGELRIPEAEKQVAEAL